MTTLVQRLENGAILIAIVLAFIAAGYPWWLLLATFLLFDLSALGYLAGPRVGAVLYNAVHDYVGPALLAAAFAVVVLAGGSAPILVIVAGCWAFHVAADRALGYGLKTTEGFGHTHLGRIGKASPES